LLGGGGTLLVMLLVTASSAANVAGAIIGGAVIGAALFVVAQSYLQDLLRLGSEAAGGVPWLAALLSPDRWLLWLGVLFVLSVYFFPTGIVGRLRDGPRHKAITAPT